MTHGTGAGIVDLSGMSDGEFSKEEYALQAQIEERTERLKEYVKENSSNSRCPDEAGCSNRASGMDWKVNC